MSMWKSPFLRRQVIAAACIAVAWGATARPAQAEPISASIVAAIGLAAGSTAATVVSGLITVGLTVGANFAINKLFGPTAQQSVSGVETEVSFGGALPRKVLWGTAATAGHLVYHNSYGNKNKRLQMVYRLADWQCEGLAAVWIDGERKLFSADAVPVGNTELARYTVDGFGDDFVVRWFDGRWDQLADKELIDRAPVGRWGTSHLGKGVAYVSLTLTYDEDKFQQGLPTLLWEVNGAKCYDRRADSTAGGAGLQRFDDATTWKFSANPAVCLETFWRGLYRQGNRIHGWGLPVTSIPAEQIIAAANVCSEALMEGGISVPRYLVSAITSEDQELRVAVQGFVAAMGGYTFSYGGVMQVYAGAGQVAVDTLSGDDLIADAEYSYRQKKSRTELVNRMSGTFLSPDSGWDADAFPTVTDAAWLAADGGQLLQATLSLSTVPSVYQAERIAKIRTLKTRSQATVRIEVQRRHIRLLPGDWINYSDDRVSGIWLITGMRDTRQSLVMDLEQISDAIFDDVTTFIPAVTIPPTTQTPIQTIQGFQIAAITLAGSGEQRRPALRLLWDDPDDPTIDEVVIEVRRVGTSEETKTFAAIGSAEISSGRKVISEGIFAGTNYEARATIATTPARGVVWTPWGSVLTDGNYWVARAGEASAASGALAAQLKEIGGDVSDGWLEIANLVDGVLDGWFEQVDANRKISGLQVQLENARGRILTMQEVMTGEGGSITAQTLQAVNADGDAGEAGAALRLQAVSAPDGVSARFSVLLKAGVDDEYSQAGFMIDVMPNQTRRVVFIADQFVLSDGEVQPFYVQDGETFIRGAKVKDRMSSADGKLVVDFAAGRISIFD